MERRSKRSGPVPSGGPDAPRERVIRLELAPLQALVNLSEGLAGTSGSSGSRPSSSLSSPRRLARLHRIDRQSQRFENAPGRAQERILIRWHLSDAPGSLHLPGSGGTLFAN